LTTFIDTIVTYHKGNATVGVVQLLLVMKVIAMKAFKLPALPYELDALAPHLSRETLEYHYGKHHAAYITNLNKLTEGTDERNMPVEEIVVRAEDGLFNNAAQAYNHTFYWHCMAANQGNEATAPTNQVEAALSESFGSVEKFREQFTEIGTKHFGSGWAWLFKNKDGRLEMAGMHDAMTPLKDGSVPLLALDVWEHAYYVDYRNARADYIQSFWKLVNWQFVERQLLAPSMESLLEASE
jgi:superoxide dismutase, Fe-Mn family